LADAVIADQLGSFLALTTVGFAAAAALARGTGDVGAARGAGSWRATVGRCLRFPPLLALVGALALRAAPLPGAAVAAVTRVSASMAPVALFAVGAQLAPSWAPLRAQAAKLALGLAVKLVVAPAAVLALYAGACGLRGPHLTTVVLESAMGPMVMGSVLAGTYALAPELAGLIVAVGVPLSLVTVPAWWWLLQTSGLGA
jgi:predicted permease